jgi:hypothetical protein
MKMRELTESKTCPFRNLIRSRLRHGADFITFAMLAIPHLLVMLVATLASRGGDLKRSKRFSVTNE